MTVIVKKVETKSELKSFVRFANDLYKGNKYYVPCIAKDDLNTFNKDKNGAYEFCDAELYLAYKNDELVGRVAAIVNYKANKTWNVNQVRYGWFDFIDDIEVSSALLDAVTEFGRSRGMTQIVGPLGFIDFDPEGMLVEGFDKVSTMVLHYNHPYYPEHMKKLGYVKEIGWVEYRLKLPEVTPERYTNLAKLVSERYNLKVRKLTSRQIRKENYGRKFFKLINETYCNLYGYSLLSDKQIDEFIKNYLSIIDPRFLSFIEDKDGNLIAGGVIMPSIVGALQKCNGEMLPFGWIHLLNSMYLNRSDTVEMLLIAVRADYQNKGVPTMLFADLLETCRKFGFKYAETNANLEDNHSVQALWSMFEKEQHKKRWVFGKEI